MERVQAKTIFVVDDEAPLRRALQASLEQLGAVVRCFPTAESCLDALRDGERCNLVLSDITMPGLGGVEFLQILRNELPTIPVVMMTGYGDVPLAVSCMQSGAKDFVEKPLEESSLLEKIGRILSHEGLLPADVEISDIELRVLSFVAEGKPNKEIAHLLGKSIRTVENHRHRLMKRLEVSGTAELVRVAIKLGLVKER